MAGRLQAYTLKDVSETPHEFKQVLTYRAFLDYVAQAVDIYKECPRPTIIERHDEKFFEDWLIMAREYKGKGEIIQFVSDEDEWDAWLEYAYYIVES